MTDPASVRGVTEELAEYAAAADLSGLPEEASELALRSLVDTLGVMIAAHDEDVLPRLRAGFGPPPPGSSTCYADGRRYDAAYAALINGVAGHALDYDDVTEITYGHPSVVLWPAILAVGEELGSSGRHLIDAYIAGFAVHAAIAAGLDVRTHYARGWHSTATIGIAGAAAACARLMGLDVEATRRAMGLAVTMAGGSRQNFGTMSKPLHPGLAARDAVVAARLAGAGFTADESILEAPLGYYAMFDAGAGLDAVAKSIGGGCALVEQGLNVKKYPCCFNTHRTADATLDLRQAENVDPAEVRAVRVTLEPGGFDPLIHHRPRTGLEGKFSAEYVIATALLDGRVALASFTDDQVRRPAAQHLIAATTWAESDVPPIGPREWGYAYSVVQLTTDRGELAMRCDVPRGDHRIPLDRAGLEAKFRDCVGFSGTGWNAGTLLGEIWSLSGKDRFTGFSLT